MKRSLTWAFAVVVALPWSSARADDPKAVIDRAIRALGGRERLEKVHTAEVKTKGTIHLGGAANPMHGQATTQGLDHYRLQFGVEVGGNQVEGVTVINGNKGWQKINGEVTPLDDRVLQGEKRLLYLQLAVGNPTVLTGPGFKLIRADKGAVTAAGPDGKEFTIHYDPQTGLPAKLVATVVGIGGNEMKQETTYSDFKDFGGVRKATKAVIKRDGEPFLEQELVEFKVLEKVDPKTFDEPK
ncbi:MAG TPA: hypothetical protein VGF55_04460 [Gemmataceae bacterium]|jgi:hypothetical protein